MSLLFRLIFATACTSTHHKLAMDALRQLRGAEAQTWRNLFLKHYERYLEGAKAPDDKFKDFKNHVLHVGENYWGGATAAARLWYERTVLALRERMWPEAVYSAGVLSHYFSDSHMPFHTGQSEEEGPVHRPAEWSVACSYDALRSLIERQPGGEPDVQLPGGNDWLADLIREGASRAHPHYRAIIERYDLARGVKDPPAGLDADSRERIAGCLGRATVGVARVLERAFAEASVQPPPVELALEIFLAALKVPVRWVLKKLADAAERAQVERMYAELQRTGKVVATLPADDRQVRELHAAEVLKVPIHVLDAQKLRPASQVRAAVPPSSGDAPRSGMAAPVRRPAASRPPETAATSTLPPRNPPTRPSPVLPPERRPVPALRTDAAPAGARQALSRPESPRPEPPRPEPSRPEASPSLRFYLDVNRPVEDAPSIGTKTAKRFQAIGVHTVAQFLAFDPRAAADRLGVRWLDAKTLREWQLQAAMVCRVPGLRGHDAQILVACGIDDPESLAATDPRELLAKIEPFLDTPAGARILRSGPKPDLREVTDWISGARQARPLKAA